MKNNVLPFPSLHPMPPDPPRTLWQRMLRWVRPVLLVTVVTGLVIVAVIVFNSLFA